MQREIIIFLYCYTTHSSLSLDAMILSNKTASVKLGHKLKEIHENKAVFVNINVFYILCIVNVVFL